MVRREDEATAQKVMALRLSSLFGNSSMLWLNAQNVYDFWHAERKYQRELEAVVMLIAA